MNKYFLGLATLLFVGSFILVLLGHSDEAGVAASLAFLILIGVGFGQLLTIFF